MAYVQRKFYFPQDLYMALQLQAKREGVRIVDKLRTYTARGIQEDTHGKTSPGIGALWDLVKLGERAKWKGPSDLSINHDKYFVEAYEELKEGKKKRI